MFDFLGNIALNLLLALGMAILLVLAPFALIRGIYGYYVPSIRHILTGVLCFIFLFVQGVLFWNAFSVSKYVGRMEEAATELLDAQGNAWENLPSGQQLREVKNGLLQAYPFLGKYLNRLPDETAALPETGAGVVQGITAWLKQHIHAYMGRRIGWMAGALLFTGVVAGFGASRQQQAALARRRRMYLDEQ